MPLRLHRTQAEVALDRHRFRVLCCGRRWGKTTLAIEEMKACAIAKPARIAYIAPTLQQARDIAWEQLKRECSQAAISIREAPRLEIILPTQQGGESLIVLRGWEAIETLRGQSFDLIIIDEVAMMRNFWVNWQEVIRPTLTDRRGEVLFISTPKGFNHFYDLFNIQDTDQDYKSYHFASQENPHIPAEEIEKAKQELSSERFAQEYLADFKKTEGLVYKEFDRAKHLFTELPEGTAIQEKIAGVDLGFTNPCAIPELWRDKTDTLWMMSEYYERGRTDAQVAEYLAAKNYNRVYPDPEAPAAIAEMRKMGVNVRDVVKGKDSVKNGINRVRELLKANKLKIHVDCRNTIMEFETYAYEDKKDKHNEEENPIKENDHIMDALRYVIMMTSRSNGQATVHYPSNTMPRDNITPFQTRQGLPPELQDKPKTYAHVHIPRL